MVLTYPHNMDIGHIQTLLLYEFKLDHNTTGASIMNTIKYLEMRQ